MEEHFPSGLKTKLPRSFICETLWHQSGFHSGQLTNPVQYNLETNSSMSLYVNDNATVYDDLNGFPILHFVHFLWWDKSSFGNNSNMFVVVNVSLGIFKKIN